MPTSIIPLIEVSDFNANYYSTRNQLAFVSPNHDRMSGREARGVVEK
mgnify:FL=1